MFPLPDSDNLNDSDIESLLNSPLPVSRTEFSQALKTVFVGLCVFGLTSFYYKNYENDNLLIQIAAGATIAFSSYLAGLFFDRLIEQGVRDLNPEFEENNIYENDHYDDWSNEASSEYFNMMN